MIGTDTEVRTAAARECAEKKPTRVLFVCTGNTCRSPMAAALYNDFYRSREVCSACPHPYEGGDTVALSAGLFARPGDPITPEAVEALREAGVYPAPGNDYPSHRAQNVTDALMDGVDLVVAISARHALELTMRYPHHAGKITTLPMDIADPFGQGSAAYRECLMQLRYCLHLMGGGGNV
ncbi:MAG: low molecular weight protein arginine phosphatase [Clostridia bacterium]|nr:low molecular weight protein arginine phosphatase [Clostridia bacterium]